MKQTWHKTQGMHVWGAAVLMALAGILGLALAGWIDHGASLFLSLAETGLSWCL
ncbi:MAG: hypothetical protein R3D65_11010 [Zhengella sp.]|uniref:hypothetical protein n=1 Tax=Zhengella sp. TaxID=2282762 RepID=UPI0035291061|nr:hypothetical protein [Brucellaceae bacterium]